MNPEPEAGSAKCEGCGKPLPNARETPNWALYCPECFKELMFPRTTARGSSDPKAEANSPMKPNLLFHVRNWLANRARRTRRYRFDYSGVTDFERGHTHPPAPLNHPPPPKNHGLAFPCPVCGHRTTYGTVSSAECEPTSITTAEHPVTYTDGREG
jgi:predicted RNA-binding Zn-ribbon protein involved in translation (DUF1610 family)